MAEQETLSPDQQNELLFLQIVMMFQGMAMQGMGKVMDPATQQVERNLDQAKYAIDTLGMLEAKTAGNLSDQEKQMLDHILFELRMNFVDETKKGPEEEAGGEETGEGDAEGQETDESESGQESGESESGQESETQG
jgi:hypothetical protein